MLFSLRALVPACLALDVRFQLAQPNADDNAFVRLELVEGVLHELSHVLTLPLPFRLAFLDGIQRDVSVLLEDAGYTQDDDEINANAIELLTARRLLKPHAYREVATLCRDNGHSNVAKENRPFFRGMLTKAQRNSANKEAALVLEGWIASLIHAKTPASLEDLIARELESLRAQVPLHDRYRRWSDPQPRPGVVVA